MPREIDPEVADSIVMTAVSTLWALPGEEVVCTRSKLKEALLAVVHEAYAIGVLAGQEMRFRESTLKIWAPSRKQRSGRKIQ